MGIGLLVWRRRMVASDDTAMREFFAQPGLQGWIVHDRGPYVSRLPPFYEAIFRSSGFLGLKPFATLTDSEGDVAWIGTGRDVQTSQEGLFFAAVRCRWSSLVVWMEEPLPFFPPNDRITPMEPEPIQRAMERIPTWRLYRCEGSYQEKVEAIPLICDLLARIPDAKEIDCRSGWIAIRFTGARTREDCKKILAGFITFQQSVMGSVAPAAVSG